MMDSDEKDLARMLGLGRVVIGATMVLFPRKSIKGYMGEGDPSFSSEMAVRGMGARDIALGTGLLLALDEETDATRWLEAGALADAGDFLSALANFRELPGLRKFLWILTAGSATFLGLKLAGDLD